jgi:hypothetical protein
MKNKSWLRSGSYWLRVEPLVLICQSGYLYNTGWDIDKAAGDTISP